MSKILKQAKKAYKRLTWQRGLYIVVLATMVLSLGQFSVPYKATAATTGSQSGTNFSSIDFSGADHAWSNPGRAASSNNSDATVTITSSSNVSEYLRVTGFGFSIPSGATIDGIQVGIERSQTDNGGNIRDNIVKLVKNNNVVGSNKATNTNWPNSDAVATYGSGTSDLWGTSWTVSDINDNDFGVVLSVGRTSGGDDTASVDHITITVHYTLPVQPVANPTLGATCGLDIALVADTSGSINSTEMTQMKNALSAFATAFSGTPTEFSLTRFSSSATVLNNFSLTPAQAATAIGGLPSSGSGYTNWEDGLAKAWSTFDPRPNPNLIIFASDGEPTESDGPLSHLEDAITVANTIKTAGARIITLGIGIDASGQENMEKISSADAYYGAASFDALAATLAQLASDLCGGTITVTKLIDDTPTSGWTFDVAGESLVTGQNGQTDPKEVNPGTYSVTETVENGYEVASAVCYNQSQEVEGTWNGSTVTGIDVSANDIITCTFNNRIAPYCGDGIVNQDSEECDGNDEVREGWMCTPNCMLEKIPTACETGVVTIPNGDFETPVVNTSENWNIYPSDTSDLGWTVGWVGSYDGAPATANLELHNSGLYTPAEGNQYSELDSDWDGPGGSINNEQASVVIYQNIDVIPYATYQLSFKLAARPGYGLDENIVRAQFGSIDQTNSLDGTGETDTTWYNYSYLMVNDNSTMKSLTFTDMGTPNSFGMFIDDVRLELVECPYPKATVIAHKIVCDSETDLPNWSNQTTINSTTAQDFVDESNGACRFVEGWEFQWGDHQINPKLDGNVVGPTNENGWYMFGSATGPAGQPAQVDINLTGLPGKLWFREVLQTGYIPFSYPSTEYPTAPDSDVSAEFWCDTDVLNYDNSEFINVSEDNTYYCVAINVPFETPTGDIHGYKWNDIDGDGQRGQEELMSGWRIFIDANDNGILDNEETYMDTSDSQEHFGWYWFEDLPWDDYKICEVLQTNWYQTYPMDPICHTVTLPDTNPQLFALTPNFIEYPAPEYNFGNQFRQSEEIPGCMDPSANNYNPDATYDDQSCTYGGGGGGPISTTQSTPTGDTPPQEPTPEPEVQVLGFETEAPAEEPEVQVLGYESLPETGGPATASNYTWFGALLLLAGTYLVRRYNI